MIEARELTKRYGDTTVVHALSFTIAPARVTGFLGPHGAGKSTTMRMIMGLDWPTSGTVTLNGKPYRQHCARLPLAVTCNRRPRRGLGRTLGPRAEGVGSRTARVGVCPGSAPAQWTHPVLPLRAGRESRRQEGRLAVK